MNLKMKLILFDIKQLLLDIGQKKSYLMRQLFFKKFNYDSPS